MTASDFLHSTTSGSVRSADAQQRSEDDGEASQASSEQQHSPHNSTAESGSAVSDTSSQSSSLSLSSLASLRRLLDVETAADLAASNVIQPAATTTANPIPASAKPPPNPSLPAHPSSSQSQYRDVGNEAVWSVSSCKAGNGVAQLRDRQLDTFWQSDGHAPHVVSLVFGRKVRVSAVCFYVDYKVDESYTPLRVSVRGGSSPHSMHDVAVMELEEPTGWVTVRTLVPQTKRHNAADHADDEADDKSTKTKAANQTNALTLSSFFPASSPTGRLLSSTTSASTSKSSASSTSGGLIYVPLRCHHLQLVIHSSHQQGKDTHVREVRVYGDGTVGHGDSSGRGRAEGRDDRSLGQKVALLHPVFTSIEFQSTACLR